MIDLFDYLVRLIRTRDSLEDARRFCLSNGMKTTNLDSRINRIDVILSAHNLKGCTSQDVYKILYGKGKKIGTMIHQGDLIDGNCKLKPRVLRVKRISSN